VSWREVIRDAMKTFESEPAFDEAVPAGWPSDPEGFARELRERLGRAGSALANVDAAAIVDARLERFLTTRLPLLRGGLVDQDVLGELGDDTRFERRPGSILVLRPQPDRLIALLGDRRLEMPAWIEPAMRRIEGATSFRLGELADALPDPDSRAVLSRRLVREGLLRPLP
jgi:hypothetical protein